MIGLSSRSTKQSVLHVVSVHDVFGGSTEVPRADQGGSAIDGRWTLFTSTVKSAPGQLGTFLPCTPAQCKHGDPGQRPARSGALLPRWDGEHSVGRRVDRHRRRGSAVARRRAKRCVVAQTGATASGRGTSIF